MENKIYQWKNAESISDVMEFEPFTLEEYNEQFGTDYKSVEEATESDLMYLWKLDEILSQLSESEYRIL